jgi:hypothetical protein
MVDDKVRTRAPGDLPELADDGSAAPRLAG